MLLTFEEFKTWEPVTDTYGLFGYPLGHTMSPELHSQLFATYGKQAEYIALEIPPEHLAEAFALASKKLKGINVTIPYKRDIMQFLDKIDEKAAFLNSVNTVHFAGGKSRGYNTDILGFAESLKRDQIHLKNREVLLVGYGGAAAVMGLHCIMESAKLMITGRNLEKAEALRHRLKRDFPSAWVDVCGLEYIPESTQIIVNGTPLGMYPKEDSCPIPYIPQNTRYIFDAIYNPPLTKLLRLGRRQNITIRDGLYMLVMQAAKAQEIWIGHQFEESTCDSVLRRLYGKMAMKRLSDVHHKSNLVLSGYMGSGKTTIGKKIAKLTGRTFYDADVYLEAQEGRTISDIFAQDGETAFRQLETKYLKELSRKEGAVIALGGGAVLRPENVKAIKKNGLLVYLNTPLPRILKNLSYDDKRPVIAGENREKKIRKTYRQRKPIYRMTADLSVSSTRINETILQIFKRI